MKTDREFLDGIYEKATALDDATPTKVKITYLQRNIKMLAIVAGFIFVAIPSLLYFNQQTMEVPTEFQTTAPIGIRGFSMFDESTLADDSEIILTAQVTKIDKSVYDADNSSIITNVSIKPTEVLKGSVDSKVIEVCVNGGYDKKSDTFVAYEAIFKRSEDVLLFLNKDPNSDSYILSGSSDGKYTYLSAEHDSKQYIGSNDTTFDILQLKNDI